MAQSLAWNQGTGVLDIISVTHHHEDNGTRAFSVTGVTHCLPPGGDYLTPCQSLEFITPNQVKVGSQLWEVPEEEDVAIMEHPP